MHDESVTLEIGPDVVIAELDGVRAEIRGSDAALVKERLAETAIQCIRERNATKRCERNMLRAHELTGAEVRRLQAAAEGQGQIGYQNGAAQAYNRNARW
jgi:hypothetical protein